MHRVLWYNFLLYYHLIYSTGSFKVVVAFGQTETADLEQQDLFFVTVAFSTVSIKIR